MTTYWQSPEGAYFQEEGITPSDPLWTSITASAYTSGLAAVGAAIDAADVAHKAQVCQDRKALFSDLVSSGLSVTAAHALSGWQTGDC